MNLLPPLVGVIGGAGVWLLVFMVGVFLIRENRALRREMATDREEHGVYRKACHAETEQMHRKILELEREVSVVKRQVNGGGK